MAYSDKVIQHYENPQNVGKLDKEDPNVGTGLVGAPACGDVMQLQLKIDEATGTIEDAKFKTFGCGSAIASSSLVTEWVKGRTVEQALSIKNMDIAKELSLPPVKIHCSVLAEDAVKAAITDYKFKAAIRAGVLTQAEITDYKALSGKIVGELTKDELARLDVLAPKIKAVLDSPAAKAPVAASAAPSSNPSQGLQAGK